MKQKQKKKSQKPIDIDAHFKYRCSKSKCGIEHWLSLKECQTKGFKVVCDCGNIFRPKRIKKISIEYIVSTKVIEPQKQIDNTASVEQYKIPVDLQNKCVKLLCSYGFTDAEAVSLSINGFQKNQTNDAGILIKYILQNLENLK